MVFSESRRLAYRPKLGGMLKILSSEEYEYACGKIFRMPLF